MLPTTSKVHMLDKKTSTAESKHAPLSLSVDFELEIEIATSASDRAHKHTRTFWRDLWDRANQHRKSDGSKTLTDRHVNKACRDIREDSGRSRRELVASLLNVFALLTFGIGTAFIPLEGKGAVGWVLAVIGGSIMIFAELFRRDVF